MVEVVLVSVECVCSVGVRKVKGKIVWNLTKAVVQSSTTTREGVGRK